MDIEMTKIIGKSGNIKFKGQKVIGPERIVKESTK